MDERKQIHRSHFRFAEDQKVIKKSLNKKFKQKKLKNKSWIKKLEKKLEKSIIDIDTWYWHPISITVWMEMGLVGKKVFYPLQGGEQIFVRISTR